MSSKINKPTAKLRSITEPPTKPQTALNSFGLTFPIERNGNKIHMGAINMMFDGNPELVQGSEPTEIGYQMLLDALAYCIKTIAEQAGQKTILNTNLLKEAAVEKLGMEKKKVKLIGLN